MCQMREIVLEKTKRERRREGKETHMHKPVMTLCNSPWEVGSYKLFEDSSVPIISMTARNQRMNETVRNCFMDGFTQIGILISE